MSAGQWPFGAVPARKPGLEGGAPELSETPEHQGGTRGNTVAQGTVKYFILTLINV